MRMPRRRWMLVALLADILMTGFGVWVSLKAGGLTYIEGPAFARYRHGRSNEGATLLESALARTPTNKIAREIFDRLQVTSDQDSPAQAVVLRPLHT